MAATLDQMTQKVMIEMLLQDLAVLMVQETPHLIMTVIMTEKAIAVATAASKDH
jgi:hypothetical protein